MKIKSKKSNATSSRQVLKLIFFSLSYIIHTKLYKYKTVPDANELSHQLQKIYLQRLSLHQVH